MRPRLAHAERARDDPKVQVHIPDFPLKRFLRTVSFPEDLESASSLICERAREELIVTQLRLILCYGRHAPAVACVTRRGNYISCVELCCTHVKKIHTDVVTSCDYRSLHQVKIQTLIILRLEVILKNVFGKIG